MSLKEPSPPIWVPVSAVPIRSLVPSSRMTWSRPKVWPISWAMVLATCWTNWARTSRGCGRPRRWRRRRRRPRWWRRSPGPRGRSPRPTGPRSRSRSGLSPAIQVPRPPTMMTVSPGPKRGLACQLSSRRTGTAKSAKSVADRGEDLLDLELPVRAVGEEAVVGAAGRAADLHHVDQVGEEAAVEVEEDLDGRRRRRRGSSRRGPRRRGGGTRRRRRLAGRRRSRWRSGCRPGATGRCRRGRTSRAAGRRGPRRRRGRAGHRAVPARCAGSPSPQPPR